ncbi:hypothetical protein OWR28_02655 [Chryseobacterium sp. 1B4]
MQATSIGVSNNSLSLTYDKVNNILTGDKSFTVVVYGIGDEPVDDFFVSYSTTESYVKFFPAFGVTAPSPKIIQISIDETLFDLQSGNYTFYITLSSSFALDVLITVYLNVIEGRIQEVVEKREEITN